MTSPGCPKGRSVSSEAMGRVKMPEQDSTKMESRSGETKVLTIPTAVRGVDIYQFPWVQDPRGDLTVGEFETEFPFRPKRYFIISGVPSGEIRGEHAHKQCHQFLICAYGQCSVTVDDGASRLEVQLNKPNIGIYVPPMIWGRQWQYSHDAALLVFASELYDPNDYIREYSAFQRAARGAG
jgi:UDP-2-acetamido-3-amino-2,3-dideoxy-glucuronate N-acetyltransferase